jgi:putative endonuclease
MELIPRNAKEIGEEGEKLARTHLRTCGHMIIETNWRYLKFEIDIVSQVGRTVVFTEVKLRATNAFGEPELFVTRQKQARLIRAADFFLRDRGIDLHARFDIIAITLDPTGNVLRHLEDAFYPVAPR